MTEAKINQQNQLEDSKDPQRQQQLQQSKQNLQTQHKDSPQNEEEEERKVGLFELFRFAKKADIILMVVGSIGAAAMGVAMPSFALLWGNMTNSFGSGDLVGSARNIMLDFIYIGIAAFVAGWLMFACWMISGERQAIECRKQYLRSLLKQQIGWFDTIDQSELASKFATDSFAFQGAIGEKVSTVIMTISMFIAGFIIAFINGWLMTFVLLASLPLIGVSGYFFINSTQQKDKNLEKDYAKAGGKAEQALSAIKTVKQLNGEAFQSLNYMNALNSASSKSLKYAILMGVGIGAMFFSMLISYSLGFWFGSNCVEGNSSCPPEWNGGNKYTAGTVLVVFFSILMAGFNLSQMTPALQKIAQGRSAAARIFKIIDREPLIKSKEGAVTPSEFKGEIKFNNVKFAYPKDKTKFVLDGMTIDIHYNNTAFVGESGCGKSTIFQLLMRFYDPDEGSITLDGVDLRDINLVWLRNQIGYVGQEPVLFATTIKENLLFGKEDATEKEIEEALKKAEAYDFVMNQLQEGLDTYVGVGGGQISGGQKQRLAIARALLKNPKLLLLDEATSALDRRNQKLIQKTLNKISEEKMTITIAHRVNTIMGADHILVFEKGRIAEQGKFKSLKRYEGIEFEKDNEAEEHVQKNVKGNGEGVAGNNLARPGFLNMLDNNNDVEVAPQQLSKEEREKQQQQQVLEKYEKSIFGRVFSYSSGKACQFILGIIVAILNGLIFPVFSIFLSKMLTILIQFNLNPVQARTDANTYALVFLIIAIVSFFTNSLQIIIFNRIGEDITSKVRQQTYEKIIKMPIPWFDQPRNNSGSLAARLASDCQLVNGLTTTYIAITVQNISTLVSGIIIAFIFEWRTSLVALGLIPLMIIAGAMQMKFNTGFSDQTDGAYKDSSSLITESMGNIRTVTSFGYEGMIERKYDSKLEEPMAIGMRKGHVSGILFGISQFIMFIVFGLIFYFGTIFIRDNGASIDGVFTAIYAIMFAGMTAGNNTHFMPDVAAAKNAAANLFLILDSEDEDQKQVREESKLIRTGITGNISLKNLTFKYETRNNNVFQNLNLEIKSGEKVAFVGASGCGKSTVMQLLQRFYEPTGGQIVIDGVDIKDYDIHYLRSCFGVVSQEPTLFNETIGFNIKYNKADATEEDVRKAAVESNFNPEDEQFEDEKVKAQEKKDEKKKAKQQKPEEDQTDSEEKNHGGGKGFNKNVGVKGSHISGGQKQRVAIARAILREPGILLLDEATSALDSINEKKVQSSLDRVMMGKTTVSIAHRIETIKNSDEILVFEKGEIVERGSYSKLLGMKGYFYNLEQGTAFI